jgi:hypothetical protein
MRLALLSMLAPKVDSNLVSSTFSSRPSMASFSAEDRR